MVNLESTPGPKGQDERRVVSHFCYVSSNKLKWGAISPWLISVELLLFYQLPQGFSSELLAVATEHWKLSDKTGREKCEYVRDEWQWTSARGGICWILSGVMWKETQALSFGLISDQPAALHDFSLNRSFSCQVMVSVLMKPWSNAYWSLRCFLERWAECWPKITLGHWLF